MQYSVNINMVQFSVFILSFGSKDDFPVVKIKMFVEINFSTIKTFFIYLYSIKIIALLCIKIVYTFLYKCVEEANCHNFLCTCVFKCWFPFCTLVSSTYVINSDSAVFCMLFWLLIMSSVQ